LRHEAQSVGSRGLKDPGRRETPTRNHAMISRTRFDSFCNGVYAVILVASLSLSGCPDSDAGTRRTWGVNLPVRLKDRNAPPNQCLERILAKRYGEIRRPADQYKGVTEYGYSLYFESPVAYAHGAETWITAAFVMQEGFPKLQFSDDWYGKPLRPDDQQRLASDLSATVRSVARECGVSIDAKSNPVCETFPPGEPCPIPNLTEAVNPLP
jgi:hypothetical protein